MSTWQQRKDYAANCLLARGLNKQSIIAILCNWYYEDGSFSPTQGEIGGGGGFGLGQWTGNARQGEIIHYARTHSEKDAIKWQCNFLVDNNPNQWIEKNGISWNAFLHNTGNWSWQHLTYTFTLCWERPLHVVNRTGAYRFIMPINWGAAGGDNTGNNTKKNARRYPTMAECMSLFDKARGKNNNGTNHPGAGAIAGFNPAPCLAYFNRYRGHIYYSMPGRAGVYSGRSADCSSFVSYMLELGYNLKTRALYTTESLHGFLKSLGYHCIEQGPAPGHATKPFKTGDVIILGRQGSSSGAGGHTGICLQAPHIYDCNFTSNGLKEYASGQAFLNWNYATNYWYHYSK